MMQNHSEIYGSSKICRHKVEDEEDLISQLPHEILVKILSLLSIHETGRTSILSTKWRYMWLFFSGTLDFDASRIINEWQLSLYPENIHDNVVIDLEWENSYVRLPLSHPYWQSFENSYRNNQKTYIDTSRVQSSVNKVLSSLKSPTIKGLKICIDSDNASDVYSWVKFAIERKVQELELDLTVSDRLKYILVIPLEWFSSSSFNSLRVLHLKYVAIDGELAEYLLSSCPFLESLSIIYSYRLKKLKVFSSSLKHLVLSSHGSYLCGPSAILQTLEISAGNLLSFGYSGPDTKISFKSVPSLVEISMEGRHESFLEETFVSLIEVLKMDLILTEKYWKMNLPKFSSVKHLELYLHVYYDGFAFNSCVALLQASPSVRLLKLKILDLHPFRGKVERVKMEDEYCFLEEVEIIGFCGSSYEVEFVMHLVENAVRLEKITIDTNLPPDVPAGVSKTRNFRLAREWARKLEAKVPPWIDFICI